MLFLVRGLNYFINAHLNVCRVLVYMYTCIYMYCVCTCTCMCVKIHVYLLQLLEDIVTFPYKISWMYRYCTTFHVLYIVYVHVLVYLYMYTCTYTLGSQCIPGICRRWFLIMHEGVISKPLRGFPGIHGYLGYKQFVG